jgi:hypothetical protein
MRRPTVHPPEGRGLDRGELARLLLTAERGDHAHAALAVLLGLNGLRVSEACDTNIEDMGLERGHRVLHIVGKGAKPALIPLVPRTSRTIDLAVGERGEGPILLRQDGRRLDRRTAHRWVKSMGKRAGLGLVHPHMLRAGFIMAALDAGVPLREVQIAARHADPVRPPSTTAGARTGPPRRLRFRRLRRRRLTPVLGRCGASVLSHPERPELPSSGPSLSERVLRHTATIRSHPQAEPFTVQAMQSALISQAALRAPRAAPMTDAQPECGGAIWAT